MGPRSWGAWPGFPKENGRAVFIIGFPVSQIRADGLLYSGLWNMDFNRSEGAVESFPVKISLHFGNCTGQPLFHMHVLLITMVRVSVTLFSEKTQACFRHPSLISSDSRLSKQEHRAVWHLPCGYEVTCSFWHSWRKCGPLTCHHWYVWLVLPCPSNHAHVSLAAAVILFVLMVQNSSIHLPWISSSWLWNIGRTWFLLVPFRSPHFC